MKFDRRGFIKLVAGGVVGLHLTPLPWKVIDDIAIWTQNWPWVPRVTKYPSFSYSQTVCTLCPGGCGIKVRMVNSKRTIKVDGQEEAPVNQGKVCPLGAAGAQYQYSLSRFEGPVKRVAARGAGVWQKVSWEDAFKQVGSRLAELRQKKMAQTVVMISGRQSSLTKGLAARFMQAYGSPNLIFTPSLGLAADFAQRAQFGPGLKEDQEVFQRLQSAQENSLGYDLEQADCVLSFGCGVVEGWGSPVRSIQAYSAWRAGGKTKLIQVDTWASLTASKADEWLAVRPGSEGALALGMAHVMVKGGLFNAKFVSEYTHGFDAFRAMLLKDYAPAAVQLLTGVPPSIITKLARQFAQAKRPLAIAGRGKGSLPTPVYELMAVMSLNALAGNINQPGGVIVRQDLPLKSWDEFEPDEEVKECLAAPRLDLARSRKYPLTTSLLHNFLESVQQDRFYPVNVLILDQANPAFLGADPTAFQAALRKIPLVVSLSGVADDSSFLADLVLPESSNFEAPVDVLNPPTLPYPLFGKAKAILKKPFFDTKPAAEIILGLAEVTGEKVKAAMPFENYKDMVEKSVTDLFEAAKTGTGQVAGYKKNFKEAKSEDFTKALDKGLFWYNPEPVKDLSQAFKTPSGKFEFFSQTLQSGLEGFISEYKAGREAALADLGITAKGDQVFLPHFEPYLPVLPTMAQAQFPLLLVPFEQFKLVTSHLGNAPYLTKLLEDITLKKDRLVVELNPQTAGRLRLSEGDQAVLETEKGGLTVQVHLFDGAQPEVVYAPLGLGHIGYDLYLRGKGSNPIEIIDPVIDPLSGQALCWGARAKLTKV